MSVSNADFQILEMESKPAKRERGKNFTESEKRYLAKIVEKYITIVENKKTDGITSRRKEKAWIDIAAEFNASSVGDQLRTGIQLKHLFGNLKRQVRTDLADSHKTKSLAEKDEGSGDKDLEKQATKDKREQYETGGGTVPQLIGTALMSDDSNEHHSGTPESRPESPSQSGPSTAIPEASPKLLGPSHQARKKYRNSSYRRKPLEKMTIRALKWDYFYNRARASRRELVVAQKKLYYINRKIAYLHAKASEKNIIF